MPLVPDHLLIAAPDLESGREFAESLTGLRPVDGGSHPGQGSRNALLGLADDRYIEIIAPDPDQSPDLRLGRYLASLDEPAFCWWCARCADLGAARRLFESAGIETGPVEPWSRQSADGSLLRWRLLMPADSEFGALAPFCIRWNDLERHPAKQLPLAGRLERLAIRHPAANRLRPLLADPACAAEGGPAGMEAVLRIGGRRVVLGGARPIPAAIGAIAGY